MRKVIIILVLFLGGCIMAPKDYLNVKTFKSHNPKTIKISGFDSGEQAEDFRGILVKTGCFKVVGSDTEADLVVVGKIETKEDMTWHYPVQVIEGLTLTPILGMPFPARLSGVGSVNLYDTKSNELLTNARAGKVYLGAWTTIYSLKGDEKRGYKILNDIIMQDLAENLSQEFCKQ